MLKAAGRILPILFAASSINTVDASPRDPFRPPAQTEAAPIVHPLQAYELDQLRLIGVVGNGPAPFAMVEDPTGLGHVVRRGTPIGKNGGRVESISQRKLVVRERYTDFAGRRISNDLTLEMSEPKLGTI